MQLLHVLHCTCTHSDSPHNVLHSTNIPRHVGPVGVQGFAYFLPFQTEKRKAWTVNRELDKLVVNLIKPKPFKGLFGFRDPIYHTVELRWRASNVTQPCNNWRRGLRFTALERPSRSCRGHPQCHATCPVPRLFLGLYWQRSKLSTTLYVLRTMTMPMANLGEIPCCSFCTPQKSAKQL